MTTTHSTLDADTVEMLRASLRHVLGEQSDRPLAERLAELGWDEVVADDPSTALRQWYGHVPERFTDFRHRYQEELREPEPARALGRLRELARRGTVTLLTATRDVEHSHAAVLAEVLRLGRYKLSEPSGEGLP